METIFGIVVLVVGIYLKATGKSDLDFIKAYAAIVGGSLYLGLINWPTIKSLFSKFSVNKSNPEQIFSPKEYELFDTKCLVHLRNRCIENSSIEGVDTCAKLNTIMFGFKRVGNDKIKNESNNARMVLPSSTGNENE